MDKTSTKANPTTRAVLALVALTLVMLPTVAPVSSAKRKAVTHGNTPLKSRKKRELGSSLET
jgi:hypothetical protein